MAIGVSNLRGIITWIIVLLRSRRVDFACPGGHCRRIGRANLFLGSRDKADMNRPRRNLSLPKPEEYPPPCPEPFQVRVSGRTVFSVIIMPRDDAEIW